MRLKGADKAVMERDERMRSFRKDRGGLEPRKRRIVIGNSRESQKEGFLKLLLIIPQSIINYDFDYRAL